MISKSIYILPSEKSKKKIRYCPVCKSPVNKFQHYSGYAFECCNMWLPWKYALTDKGTPVGGRQYTFDLHEHELRIT